MKIRMRGIRFTEVGKTTAFKDADMADVRMPADRPQRSVGIPIHRQRSVLINVILVGKNGFAPFSYAYFIFF